MNGIIGNGLTQVQPTKLIKKPIFPVKPKCVVVLMGGWSNEREVSLESGKCAEQTLKSMGHQVASINPSSNLEEFVSQLKNAFPGKTPEVIFNTLHGKWGEDGSVQGILETIGIPYTSAGVLGSALAMNKQASRQIAISAGIRIAPGQTLPIKDYMELGYSNFPHVLKPLEGGSSVDIHYIDNQTDAHNLLNKMENMKDLHQEILIENYIPGRDLSVAVFNEEAMGVVESRREPGVQILSYEAKYTAGELQYLLPAPVHPDIYNEVMRMASVMHKALHCRGVTRSDFRYDDTNGEPGILYYLETNSQPGITPTSIMPQIAGVRDWTYEDVLQWTLEDASLCR